MESAPYIPKNPETLSEWLGETVQLLKDVFEIENLSINERFILKKIAEDVISRYEQDAAAGARQPLGISREIATRFLLEAYGIDDVYINKYDNTDEDDEGFMEYIRRMREKAHLI